MKFLRIITFLALSFSATLRGSDNLKFVPESNDWFINGIRASKAEMTAHKDRLLAQSAPDQREEITAGYKEAIRRLAPEWLDEYRRYAAFLGWTPDDFAYYTQKYFTTLDCTSWVVLPDASASGQVMLHKCRDWGGGMSRKLAVSIQKSPGRFRWLRVCDAWHHGACFAMNERGLAVVMNSGDDNRDKADIVNIGSTDILRIIVEQCADVDAALKKLTEISKARMMRSSEIYLFADTRQAVQIETSAEHMASAPVAKGFTVVSNYWKLPGMDAASARKIESLEAIARREWMTRLELQKAFAGGGISREDGFAVSRFRIDEGSLKSWRLTCHQSSVGGTTFVPDAEFPGELSTAYVALGPQQHTLYLPVPIGATALPEALINGEWGERAFAFRERAGFGHAGLAGMAELEKSMLAEFDANLENARRLLRSGERAKAIAALDGVFRKQAERVWSFLLKSTA